MHVSWRDLRARRRSEPGAAAAYQAAADAHEPADPDPGLSDQLARAHLGIAGERNDGREVTSGSSPCQEDDETS